MKPARIKKGWHEAGRKLFILGDPIRVNVQDWTPIIFDGDEDPTYMKTEAIEEITALPEQTKEFQWTDELVQECIKYAMKVSPTIEDVAKWIHVQGFKAHKRLQSASSHTAPAPAKEPEVDFLQYLISQKEKCVKEHDFERASEWRMVERLYRTHLKMQDVKPTGAYISLEQVVMNYLDKEKKSAPAPVIQEGKERIVVKGIAYSHEQSKGINYSVYVFYLFPKPFEIPKEKYLAIVSAIEQVLNDDEDDLKIWKREFPKQQIEKLTEQYRAMTDAIGQKKYSQSQMDEEIDKAFNAGKDGEFNLPIFKDKYPTLADYKQSLSQDTKPLSVQPKYNSNYKAEVTYTSDKNFIVRLKAMIDREMKKAGYSTSHNNEKFMKVIDALETAEDYLFASKINNQ